MARLDAKFRRMPRRVNEGSYDEAGVLRRGMAGKLAEMVSVCEKQFPGVSVAVAFVALGDGERIEEFGFWLLNRGTFCRAGSCTDDDSGRVLLLYEVKRKQAGMVYGYQMDGVVRDGETFEVLAAGHADLLEGDYLAATEKILVSLRKYLRRLCRRAIRARKKYERRKR